MRLLFNILGHFHLLKTIPQFNCLQSFVFALSFDRSLISFQTEAFHGHTISMTIVLHQ